MSSWVTCVRRMAHVPPQTCLTTASSRLSEVRSSETSTCASAASQTTCQSLHGCSSSCSPPCSLAACAATGCSSGASLPRSLRPTQPRQPSRWTACRAEYLSWCLWPKRCFLRGRRRPSWSHRRPEAGSITSYRTLGNRGRIGHPWQPQCLRRSPPPSPRPSWAVVRLLSKQIPFRHPGTAVWRQVDSARRMTWLRCHLTTFTP
mmetsp:Transcript_25295/g.76735  ORF Transcript_25295/g.76735 Transcript_25295/m.76735 type:complete len:204 (-) Transcript_25295:234-845(-)